MDPSPADSFRRAMTLLREQGAAGVRPRSPVMEMALRLHRARLRVLESERCPTAIWRRVQSVFAGRPLPAPTRVARLVWDSWAQLSPAVRGRSNGRMLRFTSDTRSLDVQLQRQGAGPLVVHVATDPVGPDAACLLRGLPEGDLVVDLDADGAGRFDLVADDQAFELHVRELGRTLFRTPPISWRN